MKATLRVLALYPELLSIYADRGNLLMLQQRCQWRGIDFQTAAATVGDPIDAQGYDLIYIGGGQDRDQRLCAEDLVTLKKQALLEAVESGTHLLAVCGGYQLLGNYYQLGEERVEGLGIVDLHTHSTPGEQRLIGEIAIRTALPGAEGRELVGFENHGGRTYLAEGVSPLGEVLSGHGNNEKDGHEGVHFKGVIGTYLHGPLLPKNSWLADWLVQSALSLEPLEPLDDTLEEQVHSRALKRLKG